MKYVVMYRRVGSEEWYVRSSCVSYEAACAVVADMVGYVTGFEYRVDLADIREARRYLPVRVGRFERTV